MGKQIAYVVIFPCTEAKFGEIDLAIAGIFLDRAGAEQRLAECEKELAELAEDDDEAERDQPYIFEQEIG